MSRIELSFQSGRGLFKKCVGSRIGDDGKVRACIWWFTENRGESEDLAEIVIGAHQEYVIKAGLKHWPLQTIQRLHEGLKQRRAFLTTWLSTARATVGRLDSIGMPPAEHADVRPPVAAQPIVKAETVSDAAAAYIKELTDRATAGQVGVSHVRSQDKRLTFALNGFGDKPMAELTDVDLNALILRLASLPTKRKGNGHKKYKKKPISITTAKNALNTLRYFLTWADETDRWNAPKRMHKLFRQVRFKEVLTVEDAEAPHYDLAQLKSLWDKADDRLRTWLVLGLNCSFGPMELATLKRNEIHFCANPHIARFRQKTNVYGKWALWPETVELLKASMQKKGELALLNEVSLPLIIESLEGRRDAISRPWQLLVKSAEVDGSFKLLRKTGAWMIKKIAGLEESEMMLAHTEGSELGTGKMNKAYAGRDWAKLADALNVMRDQLLAAGVLTATENKAEAKAKELAAKAA